MDREIKPQQSTLSLASFLWPAMRAPMVMSWGVLLVVSLGLYIAFLSYIRIGTLERSLKIANGTVTEAIEVGDWNFVLDALRANTATGNLYHLSLTSPDGHLSFAGPFGDAPIGSGEVCREALSGKGLKLSGCAKMLVEADYGSIGLFTIVSGLFSYFSFLLLRSRALALFAQISAFLTSDSFSRSEIEEIDSVKARLSALVAEKEALSRQRALAELATQVAHDIRSPLSALRFATAALNEISDERKSVIAAATKRIEGVANQLLRQHRDKSVLATSEITPAPMMDRIDPIDLIERVLEEKRQSLVGPNEIRIIYDKAVQPVCVAVDEVEFSSVISNLLGNAIETIGSRSGEVRLSCETNTDGFFEVRISDTGPGVPTEVLTRLGERGLTFGKANGSGLGLSHAKQCATRWGGDLTLENRAEGGALVRLLIPAQFENPEFTCAH